MNLLITGAWQSAKENIEQIEKRGHVVVFLQYEKDELPCAYDWVEGIICNGLFQYHNIEKFTNLKYIQLTSAGFDRVPMKYVTEHGIEIHNARGVYSIPMAEFALGGVLQLYKQFSFFKENQKAHKWEKHRGLMELYGKTVSIIGCGSVGTECAQRFHAFGCKVVGVDLFVRRDGCYDAMFSLEQLGEVLRITDILVLTLPLTQNTRHIIDEYTLSLLKEGAIVVNIARGAIIDTKALEEALESHLGGAVLDVFEEEPLEEDSSLWERENVVVTPHNSFVGEGNKERLNQVILDNLK